MTTEKKLPQYVPRELPPSDTDLIYAGKRAQELTREEAIACAVHFRDAHVESVLRLAEAQRRMAKLEQAVSKDKVKKLDLWLKAHPSDQQRGDGGDYYTPWQSWNPPEVKS
jgi:hypothetical protein